MTILMRTGNHLKGFSIRHRVEDAVATTESEGLHLGKSKKFIYDRPQRQDAFWVQFERQRLRSYVVVRRPPLPS